MPGKAKYLQLFLVKRLGAALVILGVVLIAYNITRESSQEFLLLPYLIYLLLIAIGTRTLLAYGGRLSGR